MQFFPATVVSAWVSASILDTKPAFSNSSLLAMDAIPYVVTLNAEIVLISGVTCRQRIQLMIPLITCTITPQKPQVGFLDIAARPPKASPAFEPLSSVVSPLLRAASFIFN
jgi:hypothetical protein